MRGDDIWVFGYGSLVWRPDFPFRDRHPAYIRGWIRRFWQGSTDHRGVPESPGRVVTLLPDPSGVPCWGMAYAIGPETAETVLDGLDFRERGGFARHPVDIHFRDRASVRGTVYIATPQNANYLGPADLDAIARQILDSHGPSGPNVEYLLELARSLRALGVDDEHIAALEHRVLTLQQED